MPRPLTSKKRAHTLATALFLIGLAVLAYFNRWWPEIMLVIGIPLALEQYLLGRFYDAFVSLFVFIGVFITVQYDLPWEILLPVLFICAAIYVLFREYLEKTEESEDEKEEDINCQIEEEESEQKKRKGQK